MIWGLAESQSYVVLVIWEERFYRVVWKAPLTLHTSPRSTWVFSANWKGWSRRYRTPLHWSCCCTVRSTSRSASVEKIIDKCMMHLCMAILPAYWENGELTGQNGWLTNWEAPEWPYYQLYKLINSYWALANPVWFTSCPTGAIHVPRLAMAHLFSMEYVPLHTTDWNLHMMIQYINKCWSLSVFRFVTLTGE